MRVAVLLLGCIVCARALPSIGKNTSPWAGGERGVPGSDNRWRPVSEDCLAMIWETVRVLICGDPPRNTGFSWPRASLNTHVHKKESSQLWENAYVTQWTVSALISCSCHFCLCCILTVIRANTLSKWFEWFHLVICNTCRLYEKWNVFRPQKVTLIDFPQNIFKWHRTYSNMQCKCQ